MEERDGLGQTGRGGERGVGDVGGGAQQAVLTHVGGHGVLILQEGAVPGDVVILIPGTGGLEGRLHLSVALQALVQDVLRLLDRLGLHLLPLLQSVEDLLQLVPEPVHLDPLHGRHLPGRVPLHVDPEVPPGGSWEG